MKKLSLFRFLFFLSIAVFLMPACGEDDGLGGGTGGSGSTTAPFVDLLDDIDLVSTEATVAPGATFTVRLQALPGEADLQSLTIYEDGFQLEASRIAIAGLSATNNPQLVTGDDVSGFTWDITITAQAEMSTLVYEFEVTDVNTVSTTSSVNISTESIASGPVEISFNNPTDPIITVEGSLIPVDLSIDAGGNLLSTIAVYEDGTLIDNVADLRYKEVTTEFSTNPQPFADEDKAGFEGKIYVRAGAGTHNLTFEVTTEAGETFSSVIGYESDMTVSGTPLSGEYIAKIVYNADGPLLGGLDLDTGEVVSALSSEADIVDSGIDGNGNWLQTIQPANGAELRLVNEPLETFTYESVITKESISAAYDNGSAVAVTGDVQVGDLYTARANGVDYLLVVTNVNFTSSDNEDSYTFSVKF